MSIRSLIVGTCVVVLAGVTRAQMWSLEVIATAPPGNSFDTAGINDLGAVAYSAKQAPGNPSTTVEIWSPLGNSQLHVTPGFVWPRIERYFDSGRAVGTFGIPAAIGQGVEPNPCVWDSHGQFRRLRKPHGASYTFALDANARRQVVGYAIAHGQGLLPLLWQGEVLTVLPVPNAPVPTGLASAINEHGTIVGYVRNASGIQEGAFWQGTAGPFTIGIPSGAVATELQDVTNDGSACGSISFAGSVHAMRYVAGSFVDLGGVPGLPGASLARMNRNGLAIGAAFDPQITYPPIVTIGNGVELLGLHIDPATGAGWHLIRATDINDAGQIVATAYRPGNPSGVVVLLTPMP